ncbi:MAG: hypothetical protein OXH41_08090 [Chloroflexi bacterium]|nr:hypothetical protein [Chloroflexota bacterium]
MSPATRWFIAALAGALALAVALPAGAQDSTATVELRVWQRIGDPLRIYVSARHEEGSWATLGTIPLALDRENSRGTFRYGDTSLEVPLASGNLATTVQLRVWQHIANPLRIYVSARHETGSWATLGTIPLSLDGVSSRGTFRYGDIALDVPLPPGEPSQPLAETQNLRWLQHHYPDLHRQLTTLLWVSDGVTATETTAVDNLLYIGVTDIDNLRSTLALGWVRDGVTDGEADAIEWLYWLGYASAQDAASVIALPWFRDGPTATEAGAIRSVSLLHDEDDASGTAAIESIVALPWFRDGITGVEGEALTRLRSLDYWSEEGALAVIALPWFRDGVTATEAGAIRSVSWLHDEDDASGTAVIELVVALPWFRDGITEVEAEVLTWLRSLDYWSEEAALAVIGMPFLASVEGDDVLALRSLQSLAFQQDDRLDAVLEHQNFRDGITDDQTTLVVAAGTIRTASAIRNILGHGVARTEVAFEATEQTPDLKISIVRTGTQSRPSTVDDVRDTVEFVERIMQRPLPVDHVVVVLDDYAVTENYGGTNFGYALSLLSESEQHGTPHDTLVFRTNLVHEIAHFFWRGHSGWMDEGVARIFEYLYGVDAAVSPGLLVAPRRDGCEAHDLAMLTEWSPSPGQEGRYGCNYFLGQMLFEELLETLGREAFTQKLRELYRLAFTTDEDGEAAGIAEVRQAFDSQAAILEKHWSGALNSPESRPFDEGVTRTSHDLIQWDQHPTHDGGFVTFSGILLGDAVLSWETLADARKGGSTTFTLMSADGYEPVGSILPPLVSWGWNLDDPGDVVASKYELDGRTFTVTFRFPGAIGAPTDYVILAWGFPDASRTPFIGAEIDVLGYARIRAE